MFTHEFAVGQSAQKLNRAEPNSQGSSGQKEKKQCTIDVRHASEDEYTMLARLEKHFQPLLDKGAEVTIISERIYPGLPMELRPTLQQSLIALEIAEAGKKINVCCIVNVHLRIVDYGFDWPVYVAPIQDDLMLGCDSIHSNDNGICTRYGI